MLLDYTVTASLTVAATVDTRGSTLIGVSITNNGIGTINQCEIWRRKDSRNGTYRGYKGAADWAAVASDNAVPFCSIILPNNIAPGANSEFDLYIYGASDIQLKLKASASSSVNIEINVKETGRNNQ